MPRQPKKDYAILAIILGAASLFAWLYPIVGLPFTIIVLIYSIFEVKKQKPLAIVALVLSLIGLVAALIIFSIGAFIGISELAPESAQQAVVKETQSSDFLTYESPAYGIRVSYPKEWSKKEQIMGSIVVFFSPLEKNDGFSENANIVVQDLSENPISLEDYMDLSMQQLGAVITNFDLQDSSKTTLAGAAAQSISYTGTQGQYDMHWKQIIAIKNDNAYVLSFAAEDSAYEEYVPFFDEIAASFEIVK